MRKWRELIGNERGVALVLSLMMLLALTGLLLAFLSVSALEPDISRNLADTARARYLAEAGTEVGFNLLVNSGDATQSFTNAVTGATTGAPWRALVTNGTLTGVTSGGSTAETTFAGSYNVVVRNDYLASDQAITGLTSNDAAAATDTNKVVIMRSTGTFNGATKTIEVVVRRAALPPFPGAVNLPGVQTDTLVNDTTFDIDGRDYGCSSGCDTASNWTTTSNALKYGIATQSGTQTNKGISYETNVENAVSADSSKLADIKGKNETNTTGPYTTGLNTIQALLSTDPESLTPTKMATYLDAVRNYSGTTILQSTQACPMQLTGSGTPTNTPTLTNGCTGAAGVNQTLDLGSRTNPKLVYFKGDIDTSSQFTGLTMNSGIKGAGILIIEDGDLKQLGNFTWDGVVIVTGSYVGAGFRDGSTTLIRGAFVANESQSGEADGFFEFLMDNNTSFTVKSSKQNVDMIQLMRGSTTMTNWREM